MKYQIEHTNDFTYETMVDQSLNRIRLKPRTDECQRLLSYTPTIEPVTLTKENTDIWGNTVESFFIAEPHQRLLVKTTSVVSIQKSPFVRMVQYTPEMETIFKSDLFRSHYLAYLADTAPTYIRPDQKEEVKRELGDLSNPVECALSVLDFVYSRFSYDPEATNVSTSAVDAFDLKRGVCQDYANVMLGILRAKGLPARYVSGYLYVGENSALVGDAATHAWVEVMIPGIGWVGLDPTNNVEALEQHIRVGVGRDYEDTSPVQGVYRGGQHTLDVKVSVQLLEQH
ncbi:transglutaminase family protein [Alkalicoccus urumqiensis]|uniref:Transglutaminase family protein n=1 Tax=Alkalicoccus urumqiensis TaxID=1548213 RepID=A0A2P6MK44_ALKUR|nr:transglutaminase family protein [Alkalicoccus urumqiensis]PRO66656.1 transglutaminase family protein [Alkalicoccus urumqiensis]